MLTEEEAADTYADATDGRRLLELAPKPTSADASRSRTTKPSRSPHQPSTSVIQ